MQTRRSFQVVFWPDPREWSLGYWRWPPFETRLEGESVLPGHWLNFGFHGFCLGPVELRYWPAKAELNLGRQ
jgi:hypothetical protein